MGVGTILISSVTSIDAILAEVPWLCSRRVSHPIVCCRALTKVHPCAKLSASSGSRDGQSVMIDVCPAGNLLLHDSCVASGLSVSSGIPSRKTITSIVSSTSLALICTLEVMMCVQQLRRIGTQNIAFIRSVPMLSVALSVKIVTVALIPRAFMVPRDAPAFMFHMRLARG